MSPNATPSPTHRRRGSERAETRQAGPQTLRRMKQKLPRVRCGFWEKLPDYIERLFLEHAKRALSIFAQREVALARERAIERLNPLDVRQRKAAKIPRFLALAPAHEVVTIAVEKAVGMHDLVTTLAGAAIKIVQPDFAPGDDRLAQSADDLGVDLWPGTGPHSEPFSLGERFEIRLDPVHHRAFHQRTHLGEAALGILGLHVHVFPPQQRRLPYPNRPVRLP